MFSKNRIIAVLTAALLGLASGPLWAPMYKWVDEKGVVHYGDKIPPEYAGKANTVIAPSGVHVKDNEAQLTPEQLKARAADKKKEDEEHKKVLESQRQDNALLTTYSSVQEIDIAREKALRQAEDTIRGIQQKITDTQSLQLQLQKDASTYKGKKLPLAMQKQIDDADKDLINNQGLVVSKRKELDSIRARFDDEKTRYIKLTGGADSATATDGKAK
jgi:hypothetical protein